MNKKLALVILLVAFAAAAIMVTVDLIQNGLVVPVPSTNGLLPGSSSSY